MHKKEEPTLDNTSGFYKTNRAKNISRRSISSLGKLSRLIRKKNKILNLALSLEEYKGIDVST